MYGSYYVTIPCAAQSRGSIDGRGNASDGLRSITPCPTLHDPPLAKARGEFNMGHFSVEIYALPGSLLSSNQHSGQFYGAVDPLLNRIARTTGDLRPTANQNRTVLRWVNLAAELLLILVTRIAIAGDMLITRLVDPRLLKPPSTAPN